MSGNESNVNYLDLAIRVEPRRDVTRIVVSGELDTASIGSLSAVLREFVSKPAPRVALDMGGVGFMDSAGLSGLIAAYKMANESGGGLRILNPSPTVEKLLRMTGQFERFTAALASPPVSPVI